MINTLLLVLFGAALPALTLSKPNGAPPGACIDMIPRHGSFQPRQDKSPYRLRVKKNADIGFHVQIERVNIRSPGFRGFFVQARDKQDRLVGQFEITDPSTTIYASCFHGTQGQNSSTAAVTHKNNLEKGTVSFKWQPGNNVNGECIKFKATIVMKFNTFWTGYEVVMAPIGLIGISNSNNQP